MRELFRERSFRKDAKRIGKSGRYAMQDMIDVVLMLAADTPLPTRYKDHPLSGNWVGFRECHIKPDWLLIYRLEPGRLILVRTGSHAMLFG